jgi:hypothetical protein
MTRRTLLAAAIAVSGCGLSGGQTRCGIAALAAPGMLLEEFTRPGRTLADAPASMPEILPVRFAAGQAFRGLVGRTDSSWVIGVEGALPDGVVPGFGVLVVDPGAGAQGVVLFPGPPVPGAPIFGQVSMGAAVVPLHGIGAAVAGFQDARCPLFPDSLRQ